MRALDLTLLTDLYELTMMQGYFKNPTDQVVVFDAFYRQNPCDGGYAIAAGLEQVVVLDALALKTVGAGVHQPDVFLDHPTALFLLLDPHPLILRRGHRAHGFHLRGAFPWRSLWRESSFPA